MLRYLTSVHIYGVKGRQKLPLEKQRKDNYELLHVVPTRQSKGRKIMDKCRLEVNTYTFCNPFNTSE